MFSWIKLEHLVKWSQGTWAGSAPLSAGVCSISTDSRSLQPGEVFVALKGPAFDGHAFLEEAIRRGAVAVVVEHPLPLPISQIVVRNTGKALVAFGEGIRDAFEGPVVAVTGSAGKSSTKEMLADLLGTGSVRSPKSFNNLWGVPRTLFLVEDGTRRIVLELGMNALGEIAELCRHFKPTHGLITNIGDAHIGKMGGKEKIFQAKKELFDWFAACLANKQSSGVALNLDDEWVRRAYQEAFANKPEMTVTYSVQGKPADVEVVSREMDPTTGDLILELKVRGTQARIRFSLFGLHQAYNIAAASSAALLLGLSPKEILERLPTLKSTSQRGEVIKLGGGQTLIDESYNSNPCALIASMSSLAELDSTRRHVFVLGEMKELDSFSRELHAQAGQALVELAKKKKFPVLLVGVGAGFLPFLAAVQRGLPSAPCIGVPDADETVAKLKSLLLPGDIVLVKGSRGVQLERVVHWLKQI